MSNGWASESGRWYYPDGRPCDAIVGKNGKERPPTIRDARPLKLLPSVTSILRCARSFTLERWKAEQLLMAGLTLPRTDGELEADWIKRVWEDSQAQAIAAAERGTQIHAAIESFYRDGRLDEVWSDWVDATCATIRFSFGTPIWNAEKSFATDSYGGKIDLHAPGLVLDIKTKDGSLSDVKLYDEHAMQLAAYARDLNQGYEPPCCREGSSLKPANEPLLAAGVRGYAIKQPSGRVCIPLIIAEREGSGDVGRFLDSLAAHCVIPNVTSKRLASMLQRRGWKVSYEQHDGDDVDIWFRERTWPRAGIVFVSRTEPKAIVKELDAAELERGWAMFSALLAYWRAQNRMEVV